MTPATALLTSGALGLAPFVLPFMVLPQLPPGRARGFPILIWFAIVMGVIGGSVFTMYKVGQGRDIELLDHPASIDMTKKLSLAFEVVQLNSFAFSPSTNVPFPPWLREYIFWIPQLFVFNIHFGAYTKVILFSGVWRHIWGVLTCGAQCQLWSERCALTSVCVCVQEW